MAQAETGQRSRPKSKAAGLTPPRRGPAKTSPSDEFGEPRSMAGGCACLGRRVASPNRAAVDPGLGDRSRTARVEPDAATLSRGASADEMYDFEAITVLQSRVRPLLARNNPAIQFDCHSVRFHAQLDKQCVERQSNRAVSIFTVDLNFHLCCHLISAARPAWDRQKAGRRLAFRAQSGRPEAQGSRTLPPAFLEYNKAHF